MDLRIKVVIATLVSAVTCANAQVGCEFDNLVFNDGCHGLRINMKTEMTACQGERIYEGHWSREVDPSTAISETKRVRPLQIKLVGPFEFSEREALQNASVYFVEIAPLDGGKSIGWLRRRVGAISGRCTF